MKKKNSKKGFDFENAKRGPVVDAKTTKVMRTFRLDLDIVQWLVKEAERTGLGYQTLINSILKQAMHKSAFVTQEEFNSFRNDMIQKLRNTG